MAEDLRPWLAEEVGHRLTLAIEWLRKKKAIPTSTADGRALKEEPHVDKLYRYDASNLRARFSRNIHEGVLQIHQIFEQDTQYLEALVSDGNVSMSARLPVGPFLEKPFLRRHQYDLREHGQGLICLKSGDVVATAIGPSQKRVKFEVVEFEWLGPATPVSTIPKRVTTIDGVRTLLQKLQTISNPNDSEDDFLATQTTEASVQPSDATASQTGHGMSQLPFMTQLSPTVRRRPSPEISELGGINLNQPTVAGFMHGSKPARSTPRVGNTTFNDLAARLLPMLNGQGGLTEKHVSRSAELGAEKLITLEAVRKIADRGLVNRRSSLGDATTDDARRHKTITDSDGGRIDDVPQDMEMADVPALPEADGDPRTSVAEEMSVLDESGDDWAPYDLLTRSPIDVSNEQEAYLLRRDSWLSPAVIKYFPPCHIPPDLVEALNKDTACTTGAGPEAAQDVHMSGKESVPDSDDGSAVSNDEDMDDETDKEDPVAEDEWPPTSPAQRPRLDLPPDSSMPAPAPLDMRPKPLVKAPTIRPTAPKLLEPPGLETADSISTRTSKSKPISEPTHFSPGSAKDDDGGTKHRQVASAAYREPPKETSPSASWHGKGDMMVVAEDDSDMEMSVPHQLGESLYTPSKASQNSEWADKGTPASNMSLKVTNRSPQIQVLRSTCNSSKSNTQDDLITASGTVLIPSTTNGQRTAPASTANKLIGSKSPQPRRSVTPVSGSGFGAKPMSSPDPFPDAPQRLGLNNGLNPGDRSGSHQISTVVELKRKAVDNRSPGQSPEQLNKRLKQLRRMELPEFSQREAEDLRPEERARARRRDDRREIRNEFSVQAATPQTSLSPHTTTISTPLLQGRPTGAEAAHTSAAMPPTRPNDVSMSPVAPQPVLLQGHTAAGQSPVRSDMSLAGLYTLFSATYPIYTGDVKHFSNLCRAIRRLQKEGNPVHKSLWDDFIIRHKQDYSQYLTDMANEGGDAPLSYEVFFDEKIEDSHYHKKVVTQTSLNQALPEEAVSTRESSVNTPSITGDARQARSTGYRERSASPPRWDRERHDIQRSSIEYRNREILQGQGKFASTHGFAESGARREVVGEGVGAPQGSNVPSFQPLYRNATWHAHVPSSAPQPRQSPAFLSNPLEAGQPYTPTPIRTHDLDRRRSIPHQHLPSKPTMPTQNGQHNVKMAVPHTPARFISDKAQEDALAKLGVSGGPKPAYPSPEPSRGPPTVAPADSASTLRPPPNLGSTKAKAEKNIASVSNGAASLIARPHPDGGSASKSFPKDKGQPFSEIRDSLGQVSAIQDTSVKRRLAKGKPLTNFVRGFASLNSTSGVLAPVDEAGTVLLPARNVNFLGWGL